jgi:uncharacterized protein YdaL
MEQQEPFLSSQQTTQTQRNSFLYEYFSHDTVGWFLMFFNVCVSLAFIGIVIWFLIEHI